MDPLFLKTVAVFNISWLMRWLYSLTIKVEEKNEKNTDLEFTKKLFFWVFFGLQFCLIRNCIGLIIAQTPFFRYELRDILYVTFTYMCITHFTVKEKRDLKASLVVICYTVVTVLLW